MPLLCVDLADHRVPADRGDAGTAGAVTMLLTDHFFGTTFPRRAAATGDVPAHLLVLRPPGGHILILPASASSPRSPDLLAQAPVGYEAMVYAVAPSPSCPHRVGAPHVHRRHTLAAAVLHAVDHAHRGAHGRRCSTDRHHVEGLAVVRAADAVRAGVPVPVHDRRFLRPDARHGWPTTSIVDTYFVVAHFTTCWCLGDWHHGRRSTTGCRSGPARCMTRPRHVALLLSTIFVNVRSTPAALPCRDVAAHPRTTP